MIPQVGTKLSLMGSRRKIAVCLCNSQVVSFFYFSRQEWKHFPGLWKWATTWPYHKLEQHGVHMYHFPTYYPFFREIALLPFRKKKSNGWDKVWFQNAILNNYLPFLTFHTSVEKTLKCTFATISKKKSKKKKLQEAKTENCLFPKYIMSQLGESIVTLQLGAYL